MCVHACAAMLVFLEGTFSKGFASGKSGLYSWVKFELYELYICVLPCRPMFVCTLILAWLYSSSLT